MTPAPVIILSTPHGEAMRLAAMLGEHPRAVAFPEMGLFHAESVGALMALFAQGDRHAADGLLRAVAHFILGTAEDARGIKRARRWLDLRIDWRSSELLDALLDAVAPKVAVLPECAAPMRIRELDRCRAAVPDAHWLHLTRHPVHFRAAAMARIEGQLNVAPDYKDHAGKYPRLEPLLIWYRVHDTLMRAFAQQLQATPPSYRRLALEQLFAAPDDVLQALAAAFGWSATAMDIAAMQRPENSHWAQRGTIAAPGGVDPDFIALPHWQVPLAERRLQPLAASEDLPSDVLDLAQKLGYPVPASAPQPDSLSAAP